MRIGLDYRAAAGYPISGIGRQNFALEKAFRAHPDVQLQLFGVAPYDHPVRRLIHAPRWAAPLDSVHRLPDRLRFEGAFLPGALRDAGIEIYVANINMGLPLGRKPAGMRYVLQLHDLFQLTQQNNHGSRLKARVYRFTDHVSIAWSLKVADQIWTPSQFTADEAARLFPAIRDKLRVVPLLIERFQGEPADITQLRLPQRYWLCVGTREPRKNIKWFVDAWQTARMQFADTPELVLVGGDEPLTEAQRQLPGLHVLSGLSDAELHAVYKHAERLWQPSRSEGFGLPVIEALNVGTPVAVATGSSLDEVAPPHSPRFSPDDSANLIRLMGSLSPAPEEDPAIALEWTQRYQLKAFCERVHATMEELR
ncbi:glycosyl transferase family 1 [Pseudomonas avellanae]|uniref:Glycosyl transferase family 1 n=2 Tax=Pseudomonas syringae group TaxID=136849 RepID=A0A261WC50_9PSED|nr:glycosyltransferase family 1 protein [Pseudomonas syringae]ATV18782.1 glycosyltransferase family 1 protein [Pseudomonas syringae pv. actinidiae]OZI83503.1 glycosyl transferase family 1 [Pseudomonas avellanae]PIN59236.1 glycosyltransferase family 1 protein [Pseudomonas syringae pv. actinidiae]GAO92964.1 group 1 family glycosyl transferase PslI [Pseudomonas syringae pv. actinidiae]